MSDIVKDFGSIQGSAVPAPDRKMQAIMVGSRLTKAAYPNGLLWRELIRALYRELEHSNPPEGFEVRATAMELSWRHARWTRGPLPSAFQKAIQKVLYDSLGDYPPPDDLATAFARFIDATNCSLIIDLNYDDTVDRLLAAKDRQFIRSIGCEVNWAAASYGDDLVLWKIHGSLDAPSAIVLSPTEYQRVYEINALGTELQKLGADLGTVWTVGVGLLDDDVWAYLCGPTSPPRVVALWVSDNEPMHLKNWMQLVESPDRTLCVLQAPENEAISDFPGMLNRFSDFVKAGKPQYKSGKSTYMEDRCALFNERYEGTRRTGSLLAIRAIVQEFQTDYRALHDYLLCHSDGGLGQRWLPNVKPTERPDPEAYARDVVAVINRAKEISSHLVERDKSILAASAIQHAVTFTIEIAELHGVKVDTKLVWLPHAHLAARQEVLVGADVFSNPLERANPMHYYETERTIVLDHLLWGRTHTDTEGSGDLLTEDEWEAGLAHAFVQAQPTLVLNDSITVALHDLSVPPVFPWGYRFRDLPAYRSDLNGTVAKCWNLVDMFLVGGEQVCKGGSLIDRDPAVFHLSFRGALRAGEYTEFVAPALYTSEESDEPHG